MGAPLRTKTTGCRLRGEQRLDELARLERRQVLWPLARTHEAHRHPELVAYREDDAAFRRPVELCQYDAGYADRFGEVLRLVHRVLACRRVKDEAYLVG